MCVATERGIGERRDSKHAYYLALGLREVLALGLREVLALGLREVLALGLREVLALGLREVLALGLREAVICASRTQRLRFRFGSFVGIRAERTASPRPARWEPGV